MDEQPHLVYLNFGFSTPCSLKAKKSIPSANALFKGLQCEVEAMKQLKMKNSENNVYDKIQKALERKLGHGRLMRGMSAKEEMKIKEMINTCRQRRHLRNQSEKDKTYTDRRRVASARTRNLSAKQKLEFEVSKSVRPKTSRPLTSRLKTSRQLSPRSSQPKLEITQVATRVPLEEKNSNQSIIKVLKKQNHHHRQFSKIPSPQKQNTQPKNSIKSSTASIAFIPESPQQRRNNQPFQHFGIPSMPSYTNNSEQGILNGRRLKEKHITRIKSQFNSILENCENQKQDIVCLGRKIGHFQYFCSKMSEKKSVIEKFCKKIQVMKKQLDDSF